MNSEKYTREECYAGLENIKITHSIKSPHELLELGSHFFDRLMEIGIEEEFNKLITIDSLMREE